MGMSESDVEGESIQEVQVPVDIEWHMLDKSKFFFLGAALFSGVSATLYPIVVLKTRQQVAQSKVSCIQIAFSLIRHEGFRALYRGFGTSLMGTIPARALYMAALEITKSNVGTITVSLGISEPTAATVANAAAGLSAALAAPLVWTAAGHINVVKELIKVNNKPYLFPNEDGKTPLHYAVMRGRTDVVRELVKAKPESMSFLDSNGNTVFHMCVIHNHLETLKALVELELAVSEKLLYFTSSDMEWATPFCI